MCVLTIFLPYHLNQSPTAYLYTTLQPLGYPWNSWICSFRRIWKYGLRYGTPTIQARILEEEVKMEVPLNCIFESGLSYLECIDINLACATYAPMCKNKFNFITVSSNTALHFNYLCASNGLCTSSINRLSQSFYATFFFGVLWETVHFDDMNRIYLLKYSIVYMMVGIWKQDSILTLHYYTESPSKVDSLA